ncbi:MAG: hypothetical protein ACFB16_03135 [Phormidesmis sp.]
MANPNPKTDHLRKNRGKRPKLNNSVVSMRLSQKDRQVLDEIAIEFGCKYAGKPWIAGLLHEIAVGNLLVVETPPSLKLERQSRYDNLLSV